MTMHEDDEPAPIDNQSTYMIADSTNPAEMIRLLIQDRFITEGMGGPLSEQPPPLSFHHILDIGCGPGGWALRVAKDYPQTEVLGIDISWKMIEDAQAQARVRRITNAAFRVMDARQPLDLSTGSFDLVNVRLASGFMGVKDWPILLQEVQRILHPGGIARLTDAAMPRSNSVAYTQLNEMFLCALSRAGHIPALDNAGLTPLLPQLLAENGFQSVQTVWHNLHYTASTEAGYSFYQDIKYLFETLKPFLRAQGCMREGYDDLYNQAMLELRQQGFHAVWKLLVAWGTAAEQQVG